MMSQIEALLKGKKTYGVVIIAIVLGVLEGYDVIEISAPMWIVLSAAGLGFLRSSVNTIEKTIEKLRNKK